MALAEGALKVTFAGGIETKMDAKAVPSTRLTVLENGVFTRAISIRKRNGYAALSHAIDGSPSTVDAAIRLASRDDELLSFTSNRCYSRQSGAEQWSDAGPLFSAVGSERPLVKTGTQQLQPDAATMRGVTAVAWEDSNGGVWWSVVDAVSGRVLRAPTQADAAGISPRCVATGNNLHIYFANAAQRRLLVVVVNPAAPSATVAPVVLVDDLDATNPVYDACATARADAPAAIAWKEHGTSNVRIGYVDDSGVLGSPLTGHPSVITYPGDMLATSPLAVAFKNVDGATGDLLAVVFVDSSLTARHVLSFGGDGATPITPDIEVGTHVTVSAQRCTATFADDAGSGEMAWSAWEEAAAAPSNRYCTLAGFNLLSGSPSTTTVRSVGLAGGAFHIGVDAFATFVHDTTYFNSYVTLRLADAFPAGRHAPGLATGAPPRRHLPSANVVDGVASVALPIRERVVSENADKFRETGIRLISMDFDSEDSHQTAQLGRGLYLAGACPMHYDGKAWTEQGFHFGPEAITATPAAGGSMTASTTYLYRVWYEWTDAQGEVHRGPVSFGTLVTMAVGQTQVTLQLPTLRVTKKENVRICVARSKAAATGNTTELFRVTSLDPITEDEFNGYVSNRTDVDVTPLVDQMSDAVLATQEGIYTVGGILSNDPSPLGSVIARGKSRLFFTDPADGNLLRFSQELGDGYGAECPPELQVKVDPFGGPVTALANQDDRVVVFKASAIYMFSGDGPTVTGDTANGGFSRPQLVTSDVGCTDPSSIVLTPAGHMFKSAKGIYLLDNGGGVQYVGAPVEAFNAQRVRRATVMPDRTQVVFLTDEGSTLLFDYLFSQWSTFTNHLGFDAAIVSNAYHYLRTDGRVFRETVGQHSDAGQRIRLRFETAWIHMQEQLQGFQRFWFMHLLGSHLSPHQLGIQYRTDYTPQWTDPVWLDATGLTDAAGWITGAGANPIGEDLITGTEYSEGEYDEGPYSGTSPEAYEWRLHLSEKGASIQFRFEDFEAVGYAGASFELTEMLITGGVKSNARRPFTAARSA